MPDFSRRTKLLGNCPDCCAEVVIGEAHICPTARQTACGMTSYCVLGHPFLICGRKADHSGVHIHFTTNLSIGFGADHA